MKINQGMKISIQDFIQAKTIGHLIMNKTNDLKKNLKPILSVVDDVKVDKYSRPNSTTTHTNPTYHPHSTADPHSMSNPYSSAQQI